MSAATLNLRELSALCDYAATIADGMSEADARRYCAPYWLPKVLEARKASGAPMDLDSLMDERTAHIKAGGR